jgi:hypothetical protein
MGKNINPTPFLHIPTSSSILFYLFLSFPLFSGAKIQIFLPGCFSPPNVAFRFVYIKDVADLFGQLGINDGKAFRQILMDCTLADPKGVGCLPHCSLCCHQKFGYLQHPLVDMILHGSFPPSQTLINVYAGAGK